MRRRKVLITSLLALATVVSTHPASAASPTAPPATVPRVDLDRYSGRWYEIARFPTWFQKKCLGDVSAEYVRRPDGRIDVFNRCRVADGSMDEARGIARLATKDGSNSKLEVRFAPAWLSFLPVWGDYWIIGLSPDYAHAIVGDRKREYLWILARAPQLDEATYDSLVKQAAAQGFDVSRLVRTKND